MRLHVSRLLACALCALLLLLALTEARKSTNTDVDGKSGRGKPAGKPRNAVVSLSNSATFSSSGLVDLQGLADHEGDALLVATVNGTIANVDIGTGRIRVCARLACNRFGLLSPTVVLVSAVEREGRAIRIFLIQSQRGDAGGGVGRPPPPVPLGRAGP